MPTLAFALAATIKHDGHGGVADLLETPQQTATWLTEHDHLIADVLGAPRAALVKARGEGAPGDGLLDPSSVLREGRGSEWGGGVQEELLRVRRAVRALFARAVEPEPPSKADADRLMKVEDALRMINRAADRLGTTHLLWTDEPVARWAPRTDDPTKLLIGAVGRSAIDFLVSPDRTRLRACPAARCVKYFLQDDPRQTWCSPSCGNRERVNRAYRKRTAG
ncbi:ABATE domain-containing protein [Kribbella sp. NPDC054772]